MTLIQGIYDRLVTLPAVAALVDKRIYFLTFPQSVTAPAIRMQEIDRISSIHLRGDLSLRRARIQIDSIESAAHGPDPYETCHALADAIRGDLKSGGPSGLAGFRGDLSGIPIAAIEPDQEREEYDGAARMIRIEQDFIVWFHV